MANQADISRIADYAEALATSCPEVETIWLIGSRANGTQRANSDWDLLVFAATGGLECLATHSEHHRDDVDCLVQTGPTFKRAWGEAKSLSLPELKWQDLSPSLAAYIGKKWSDREGSTGVVPINQKAIRVWPRR